MFTPIHISDVSTYKTCRRKWHYASTRQLGLEPNSMYAPFYVGRAVHAALEAYYANNTPPTEAVEAFMLLTQAEMEAAGNTNQLGELNDNMQMLTSVMTHYEFWSSKYKGEFGDKDLKFLSMEVPFRVLVNEDLSFGGRFDGLVLHIPTGDLYLWETKTTASMESYVAYLDRSEQATAYVWAARQMGYDVKGVLYNIIRKKAPAWPEELKSGVLSKNKSIDTTAEVYLEAVKLHHKDELSEMSEEDKRKFIMNEYGDVLKALKAKDAQFISRVAVIKTLDEVDGWLQEYLEVASEMLDPDTPLYRNESQWNCQYCPFKAPCEAAKKGDSDEEQRLMDFLFHKRVMEVHITGE